MGVGRDVKPSIKWADVISPEGLARQKALGWYPMRAADGTVVALINGPPLPRQASKATIAGMRDWLRQGFNGA